MKWTKTELPDTWRKLYLDGHNRCFTIDSAGPIRRCQYLGTHERVYDACMQVRGE